MIMGWPPHLGTTPEPGSAGSPSPISVVIMQPFPPDVGAIA